MTDEEPKKPTEIIGAIPIYDPAVVDRGGRNIGYAIVKGALYKNRFGHWTVKIDWAASEDEHGHLPFREEY